MNFNQNTKIRKILSSKLVLAYLKRNLNACQFSDLYVFIQQILSEMKKESRFQYGGIFGVAKGVNNIW